MAVLSEVFIGSTLKELRVTLVDEDNNVRNISGGTVKLQGKSDDLPGKTLDVDGEVLDGPNGVAQWVELGGTDFVTTADMGGLTEATFRCQVKFTDAATLVDYGPVFELVWKKPIV